MQIKVDKIASCTKNVPLKAHDVEIRRKITAEDGAVIVVEVLQNKKIYNQLELTTGRLSTIHKNDILVVSLGSRRALKGFAGDVPKKVKYGDILHLLNFGGVTGICTSSSIGAVGQPLKVRVLGSVVDKNNNPINIQNYSIFKPENTIKSKIPVIAISGTCMHVGKTTIAAELIKTASHSNFKVAGAKVAGIAALRDTLKMEDYGAIKAVSITDAGHTTTANMEELSVAIAKGAINYLSKDNPDLIVIELGDGILGEYGVLNVLEDKEFQQVLAAHIGCAGDPLGAAKLFEICQAIGVPLHLISGPVTDNSVGTDFIKEYMNIKAFNCISQGERLLPGLIKKALEFNLATPIES
ncbi:hypothetical protein GF340_04895 [Candidatus Peregrinibacteria bacterium]|nr:hypothetical protein [Candidatus Peregrinibacteria bacterium]